MPERGRLSERLAGLSAMPPQPMVDLDEASLVLRPSEIVKEPQVWRASRQRDDREAPAAAAVSTASARRRSAEACRAAGRLPARAARHDPPTRSPHARGGGVAARRPERDQSRSGRRNDAAWTCRAEDARLASSSAWPALAARGKSRNPEMVPAKREPEFGQQWQAPETPRMSSQPQPQLQPEAQYQPQAQYNGEPQVEPQPQLQAAPRGVRIDRPRPAAPVALGPKRVEPQPRLAQLAHAEITSPAPAESQGDDDLGDSSISPQAGQLSVDTSVNGYSQAGSSHSRKC